MPFPTGTKLGSYDVLKTLARGSACDLLLARARGMAGFERHVVIKWLREEVAQDTAAVDAFISEARLAASLHHHNIVQVQDIGQEHGRPFFAMEYVHGEDLRTILARLNRRGMQLPIEHVVTIGCAVAAALHHAHEQRSTDGKPLGIVHRDVSPGNIIVGYDGNVKVVDFGIAKATITAVTQVGKLKGKSAYMAPEQAERAADRRSDIYALGIVTYEMSTVRRLYKGANDHETMQLVTSGNVPPPSRVRPDLPAELEAIIMKALARLPADRYQTAAELGTALEKFGTKSGRSVSTNALAAFLKQQFEERPEPWRIEDSMVVRDVELDFDGKQPGLATSEPAPAKAAVPVPMKPMGTIKVAAPHFAPHAPAKAAVEDKDFEAERATSVMVDEPAEVAAEKSAGAAAAAARDGDRAATSVEDTEPTQEGHAAQHEPTAVGKKKSLLLPGVKPIADDAKTLDDKATKLKPTDLLPKKPASIDDAKTEPKLGLGKPKTELPKPKLNPTPPKAAPRAEDSVAAAVGATAMVTNASKTVADLQASDSASDTLPRAEQASEEPETDDATTEKSPLRKRSAEAAAAVEPPADGAPMIRATTNRPGDATELVPPLPLGPKSAAAQIAVKRRTRARWWIAGAGAAVIAAGAVGFIAFGSSGSELSSTAKAAPAPAPAPAPEPEGTTLDMTQRQMEKEKGSDLTPQVSGQEPEPAKPVAAAKAEPAKPEPAKPEPAKPEPVKPEPKKTVQVAVKPKPVVRSKVVASKAKQTTKKSPATKKKETKTEAPKYDPDSLFLKVK